MRYSEAEDNLKNQNFEAAYTAFVELDDYKNSKSKVDSCIYQWSAYILDLGLEDDAIIFKDIVELSAKHYQPIYASICNEINDHSEFSHWNNTSHAKALYTMLQCLPSTFESTDVLTKLLRVASNGEMDSDEYVRENKVFLKSVWNVDFVQDFLTGDARIAVFLEGHWTTSNNGYYLTFYENDNGGTDVSYNLPWVAEPAGTKYYDIYDRVFVFEDDNDNELAKVYKFTFDGFDAISVFCYKDNRTYKLYR